MTTDYFRQLIPARVCSVGVIYTQKRGIPVSYQNIPKYVPNVSEWAGKGIERFPEQSDRVVWKRYSPVKYLFYTCVNTVPELQPVCIPYIRQPWIPAFVWNAENFFSAVGTLCTVEYVVLRLTRCPAVYLRGTRRCIHGVPDGVSTGYPTVYLRGILRCILP